MQTSANKILHTSYWLLATALLLIAIWFLITQAPKPSKDAHLKTITSVPVLETSPQPVSIPVTTHGHLEVARQFHISSQVKGRVLEVSHKMLNGSHVEEGEVLLKVDPQPYLLAVNQHQAELDARLLQLEEVKARAKAARNHSSDSDYARFIPQLRMANSQLAASRSALKYAQQQLSSTQITAPISGRLDNTNVQPGQHINSNMVLAVIYDDNFHEVRLQVTDKEASILSVTNNQNFDGLHVTLRTKNTEYPAQIIRSEAIRGAFQQISLIARPLYPQEATQKLLPGTYVEAQINSPIFSGVTRIPHSALQAGNQLYLVDQHQLLYRRGAKVLYRDKSFIYIRNHFEPETLIVNSSRRMLPLGEKVHPVLFESNKDSKMVSIGQE